jgi:hypothetical protein
MTHHHREDNCPTEVWLYVLTGKINFLVYSESKDWIWSTTGCKNVLEDPAESVLESVTPVVYTIIFCFVYFSALKSFMYSYFPMGFSFITDLLFFFLNSKITYILHCV